MKRNKTLTESKAEKELLNYATENLLKVSVSVARKFWRSILNALMGLFCVGVSWEAGNDMVLVSLLSFAGGYAFFPALRWISDRI